DFLLRVLRREGKGRQQDRQDREAPHHASAVSVLLVSPRLSSQLTSILSPLAPPRRRKENTGLRDTAWLVWPSITVRPFTFTVRFWMKCIGTTLPSGSLRWPVSIGWVISTRTSVKPPASVARIFIGPAMSASAPADSHLDLLRRHVMLAAGLGDDAHVGGFAHLHVHLHERQRALGKIELGDEREGVLVDQHQDRGRAL